MEPQTNPQQEIRIDASNVSIEEAERALMFTLETVARRIADLRGYDLKSVNIQLKHKERRA